MGTSRLPPIRGVRPNGTPLSTGQSERALPGLPMPPRRLAGHGSVRAHNGAMRTLRAIAAACLAVLAAGPSSVLPAIPVDRALGAYEVLERLAEEGFGNQPPVAYRALDFLVEQGLAHRIRRLNAFAANVETDKLSVATKRGSVEQRQSRLKELQIELQQSSTEQDQLLQQQAEKRSRLSVLEQLQGSHEGFSAGAVAALRKSRSVIGSLADRIRDLVAMRLVDQAHEFRLELSDQPAHITRSLTTHRR